MTPRVYFYHTQDIQMILRRIQDGEFPPHFLYGAAKLGKLGVGVAWHVSRLGLPRWRMMLRNSWRILRCREPFDAIYATHYRGIEPIVMLRALGLYRKPVIVWHHQPVVTPEQRWREALGRIFYRGFDRMIFFSRQLIATSLRSPKARSERVVEGHWGGCLEFYDRIAAQARAEGSPHGFISRARSCATCPRSSRHSGGRASRSSWCRRGRSAASTTRKCSPVST